MVIFDTIKNVLLLSIVGLIVILVIDPQTGINLIVEFLTKILGIGYDTIVGTFT